MKKKKSSKQKRIKGKGEVSMTLYDINKQLISQLPAYDMQQINEVEDRINDWEDNYSSNQYFMLLCNDIHYYTILHRSSHENADFPDLGQATINLLLECGYTIHADELLTDYCEIWAKNDRDTYAFLLFPYDEGVVTYG